jgi:F0F1-type ATP synthase assembly protein I
MNGGDAVRHPGRASATIPRVLMRRASKYSSRALSRDVGEGWSALSTLIAGMGVWGAIGYGLDRLFGTTPVLFVIGIVGGIHLGAYLVYVHAVAQERARET